MDGFSKVETQEGHGDNTSDFKENGEVRSKKKADKLINNETGAYILNPDEENNHCILTSHTSSTSQLLEVFRK